VPPASASSARRPRAATVAATSALAIVLLLAGCTAAPKHQVGRDSTPSVAATNAAAGDVPADVAVFYQQVVSWSKCDAFDCAKVKAPLDWANPTAGSIDLAIKRSAAKKQDQRLGSLLIDPGGPGASGQDLVDHASTAFGASVRDVYDIVGFDPRGVGSSTAVKCGTDKDADAYLTADKPMTNQTQLDAERARTQAFGELCQTSTGALLAHVDTVSAAKDMDLLRGVLGDTKLNYLGFSYGTFLGATYAGLFPKNVGRVVLDGSIDPALDNDTVTKEQAAGFEQALRAYVADCEAGPKCPLTGGVDGGLAQIQRVMKQAQASPLPTAGGQHVNALLAFYGLAVTLYDQQSWPYLTIALTGAIQNNDASTLLQLANFYLDRKDDGTYTSNANLAFMAINCLDYPVVSRTIAQLDAFAADVRTVAPTFGDQFVYAAGCEAWPIKSTGVRAPIRAAGAAPILVVGTTGDPATPYQWAVSLAGQLESGHLLTFDGQGHTAYTRSNACIMNAVDAFLVSGTVPADGKRC